MGNAQHSYPLEGRAKALPIQVLLSIGSLALLQVKRHLRTNFCHLPYRIASQSPDAFQSHRH